MYLALRAADECRLVTRYIKATATMHNAQCTVEFEMKMKRRVHNANGNCDPKHATAEHKRTLLLLSHCALHKIN